MLRATTRQFELQKQLTIFQEKSLKKTEGNFRFFSSAKVIQFKSFSVVATKTEVESRFHRAKQFDPSMWPLKQNSEKWKIVIWLLKWKCEPILGSDVERILFALIKHYLMGDSFVSDADVLFFRKCFELKIMSGAFWYSAWNIFISWMSSSSSKLIGLIMMWMFSCFLNRFPWGLFQTHETLIDKLRHLNEDRRAFMTTLTRSSKWTAEAFQLISLI